MHDAEDRSRSRLLRHQNRQMIIRENACRGGPNRAGGLLGRIDQILHSLVRTVRSDPDHARIEHAKQLVASGGDLEAIAAAVGYADASTLRNLLRRKLGRGVRELRAEMR